MKSDQSSFFGCGVGKEEVGGDILEWLEISVALCAGPQNGIRDSEFVTTQVY